ncbi:hypothetical protein [Algoriphagus litoralis]|uniref:hypothetical protein n=1 Tax=Algoriphagus litoralis TaxID=2202829 RepID=UPI000DB99C36|nr:hypothetical protein [Algoriphagus litoralis]
MQNRLNGGKPLPAEEKFYIRGAIPSRVELVKVTLYPSKKSQNAGYSYFWKAPFGYNELSFQILIEEPLRSNEDYHVEFGFYQKAGKPEIEELRKLILVNLSTYMNTITSIKRGGIHFEDSDDQILINMSKIVETGAYYFELPNGLQFPGFSDLTRNKLHQRKNLKMGNAKYNVDEVGENENAQAIYSQKYLDELMAIVSSEIDQYLSTNMLARVDEKFFQNYPSEKKANVIPINLGYGAISLSKTLPQQEFVYSPYLGFSFPLGNRTFTKFMNNVSISTGVFVSGGMENSLEESIKGPLFDRPVYLGLGYNFFRFIRLNAGGTFTTTNQANGNSLRSFSPFLGLSAEFNIWLGFGNKK